MSYFDMCEIATSDFNRKFAESDLAWELVRSTWENPTSGNIPKIIHFIWLGSPIPKIYDDNILDWADKTGLPCKIWTDDTVKDFPMINHELYEKATNYGAKSDILRYEILYQFGGAYIDTDHIIIDPIKFNELFTQSDFFGCICYDKNVLINNGFLMCEPKHPVILDVIRKCRLDDPWNIQCEYTRTQWQTGPQLLTRSALMYRYKRNNENMKIAPTTVINPFPPALRHEATEEAINKYIKPETIAVHLWHSSYSKNSMFSQVK